ncbi:MAG TPA: DUF2905 domain-containing protein [Thermodesulfobacteriota bacterium]|nr:DUF2905 domain-containing protein [Thermodesulfobacteriota bacterium]
MNDPSGFGKILLVIGIVIALAGLAFMFGGKVPWLGRLPGDITLKGKNYTFYFPLATSIVVSIILSVIFYLINRK